MTSFVDLLPLSGNSWIAGGSATQEQKRCRRVSGHGVDVSTVTRVAETLPSKCATSVVPVGSNT